MTKQIHPHKRLELRGNKRPENMPDGSIYLKENEYIKPVDHAVVSFGAYLDFKPHVTVECDAGTLGQVLRLEPQTP